MRIIYNDNDKGAAAWLSELGRRGAIPRGRVITTSITELEPGDVAQADQVHFFAGIGGWVHASELAGYADLRCWTGSPPCQPFSVAGQQRGKDDARHLAPAWLDLIKECQPELIFGEQVEAAIRHGWLDDLFDALEKCGYTCGAAVLPACSVGAPHIRKRLFFGAVRLADTECRSAERYGYEVDGASRRVQGAARKQRVRSDSGHDIAIGGLANSDSDGCSTWREIRSVCAEHDAEHGGAAFGVAYTSGTGRRQTGCAPVRNREADARWPRDRNCDGGSYDFTLGMDRTHGANPHNRFWSGADWLGCRDGKFRPVEPKSQPLVDGLPKGMVRGGIQSLEEQPAAARVMRLRGYGNAIVPQVAATFITCFMESVGL